MTPEEKKYYQVAIGDALQRASWSAAAAYYGKRPDGALVSDRGLHAQYSLMWSNYALAMQREREWEQNELRRVKESLEADLKGGEHAEVRTDGTD